MELANTKTEFTFVLGNVVPEKCSGIPVGN
jgi:hypothetical protein